MRIKKIIIAENIKLIRDRVKELLSDYEVYAVDNGKELIKLYREIKPDLLIVDIRMPELSGYEAIELIRKENKEVKILVYTVIGEKGWIKRLLKLNVSYLYKDEVSEEELRQTVDDIFTTEEILLSPYVKGQIKYDSFNEDLTSREVEVVEEMKDGKSPKQISEDMFLSLATVRTHIKNIHKKLKVTNTVELLKYAENAEIV